MSTANNNHIITRYLVATLGLFLVGFGVALTIVANLGTAPLSCVAYVFNLRFPSVSVGPFILAVNMVYMLVQILVLRKRFKMRYLMQIPASVLFNRLLPKTHRAIHSAVGNQSAQAQKLERRDLQIPLADGAVSQSRRSG